LGRRPGLLRGRQDDEREVRPSRLLAEEPGEAPLLVVEDGLVRHDRDGRTPLDLRADTGDIIAEGEGNPDRLEELAGCTRVPLGRGEQENPLLKSRGRFFTHWRAS
jgi:hypothetical protein